MIKIKQKELKRWFGMRQNLLKYILILKLLVLSSLYITRGISALPLPKTSYVSHAPIDIDGNTEIDTFFSGDGTDGLSWETAHIIENLEINGTGNSAILIQNSDRYIIIKNCYLYNWESYWGGGFQGITLRNCQNIKITKNMIKDCGAGIEFISNGPNISVLDNEIFDCWWGIRFDDSSLHLISGNTIRKGTNHGITLMGDSNNNTITENNVKEFNDGAIYLDFNTDYNEVCHNCLQGIIDDRGDTNNCFDNNNCPPSIPGYPISIISFIVLSMPFVILVILRKKFKNY